ncbi:MAG: hypothetical protein A2079_06065 [Geobacteraceae bacterium GWC2_48_7]|nr:MAG: hypothetical protein A2079_06065 [Geobacteraceae bacterium GWC2_48_7]
MRMYIFKIIVFLAVSFTVQTAYAETLTLKECLEKADKNHPSLKTALWDSRISAENVRLTSASSFPRIDAQAAYTMQQSAQAVVINGVTAETQEPDFASAGISLGYTLYDFGRRNARINQSRLISGAATDRYAAFRSEIGLQVIETFFSILELNRLATAAEEEVKQVEQHRLVAVALYEEGVVTRNDVLQAEVRLAAARQNLLALNNRRENRWLLLNYQTGMEQSYRVELDENASVGNSHVSAEALFPVVIKRNEIQALRKQIKAGEAEVRSSKGAFYPEIFSRLILDYVQNDKLREETIMAAVIGIRINLFDGFASTSLREKAVLARYRAEDELRQAEAAIRLEIATAGNDLQVSGERISVNEKAIMQSEENLRINRERYKERVGTATEVLDAQTLLTQARRDYYRALYDYQVAAARLKKATGEL